MTPDRNEINISYSELLTYKKAELQDLAEEVNAIYGTDIRPDQTIANLREEIALTVGIQEEVIKPPVADSSPKTIKRFINKTLLGAQ